MILVTHASITPVLVKRQDSVHERAGLPVCTGHCPKDLILEGSISGSFETPAL